MEPDLAELLESCGLSHLRQKIEEERFDWETLKCLDITTVACLTPFGGEQCKLLQKIAEYKRRTVEVSAIGSPPSSDLTTNSSALVHSQSSGSTSSCASTSSTASPLASTSSTSSSKRPSSSNAASGAAKRCLTAIDYVQKFEKYDLRKALETDALCKHILLAYQSEVENYNEDDVDAVPPVLSDFQRDKLTALIGTFIRSVTIYPDHKLYPIFTRKIKEVFPFESEDTFYIQPYTKGPKQTQPCGKLANYIRNKRNTERLLGNSRPAPNRSSSSKSSSNSSTSSNLRVILSKPITDQVKAAAVWLKLGRSPWPLVTSKWVECAPLRFNQLFKHSGEVYVNNYLADWPVLDGKSGHELILEDFKLLYPSATDALWAKWDMFLKRTINLAKKDVKDKLVKKLLKAFSSKLTQNQEAFTLLQVLHAIRPSHTVEVDQGDQTVTDKISMDRARDSYLVIVKCVGDIKEAVEKRRAQMISGGKGAPLIVVVDQEKSQSAYVSVAKLLYKVESVLHALDLCFKSFFALHIAYPDESKHIWIVLQRAIYGFTTEWDPEVIQSSWIQVYA